jgi:hypothetical protein
MNRCHLLLIYSVFTINSQLTLCYILVNVTQAQTFAISGPHFIYTKNLPTKNGRIISGDVIKVKVYYTSQKAYH